jgi:hypothetical protein
MMSMCCGIGHQCGVGGMSWWLINNETLRDISHNARMHADEMAHC